MQHEMNLRPGPFAAIASGRKTYELRLLDEKRKTIRIGDTIRFTCTTDQKTLTVRVCSLHPFRDFAELYAAMPLEQCGYTLESVSKADPADMEKYYPPEKQALYGVVAIGIERIRLPLQKLSGSFDVRELTPDDADDMLRIARSNPMYYEYMQIQPDTDGMLASLQALPPGRTAADKHFFGWYQEGQLLAFMDLILHHPRLDAAFIGWFMVDAAYQRQGVGTRLVKEVLQLLTEEGIHEVRLGRVKGNPQSVGFWRAMGFADCGIEYETDGYTVVVMSKMLE